MKWISKYPPIYVWENDIWLKEPEYIEYNIDILNQYWFRDAEKVHFPKKVKLCRSRNE